MFKSVLASTDGALSARLILSALTLIGCFWSARIDAQDATGTLAGCVSDMARSPIPGTTIQVTGLNVDRTVTTEADGCFRLSGLPPATYLLVATLPGFSAVTRDELRVQAGALTRVDFRMRVAPICECVIVAPPTVPSLWAKADVVAHIRIGGHDYGPENATSETVTHTSTVLRIWKDTHKAGEVLNSLRFVHSDGCSNCTHAPFEPYAVGQQFILFLTAQPDGRPFTNTGAFALENGRVHSAPVDGYQSKSVDDLVAEIVALVGK